MRRSFCCYYFAVESGNGIPLNDDDNVCHSRIGNRAGQRSDDSRVVDGSKVVSGITDAGHEAARNRSRDERLRSSVGSGLDLTAAADGHRKTELQVLLPYPR